MAENIENVELSDKKSDVTEMLQSKLNLKNAGEKEFKDENEKQSEQRPSNKNDSTVLIRQFKVNMDAIGSGRLGVVFRCIHAFDKSRCALKVIPLTGGGDSLYREGRTVNNLQTYLHTVSYARFFIHEYVPAPLKAILEEKFEVGEVNQIFCITMALYPRTLDENINKGFDDEKTIWRLFGEILMGVDHLHKKGYIHTNLSRYNILLDICDSAKLAIFGLTVQKSHGYGSDQLQDDFSNITDSISDRHFKYYAPERFQGKICQKSNIYQLGLILFEMIHPMSELERIVAFQDLKSGGVLPITFLHSTAIKYMVLSMLSKQPNDRPNLNDLIMSVQGFRSMLTS